MSTEETTRVAMMGVLNITTTTSTITTNAIIPSTTTTGNDGAGFNYAVIAVVGVVVFVVVLCLKCCQRFRRYTRGNEKNENNQYAVIVADGDDDYFQIDMLSESASTQYDTVSSFCSFQKRNNNKASTQYDTVSSLSSFQKRHKTDNNNKYKQQFRSSNLLNKSRSTESPRQCQLSRLGFSRESGRLRSDTSYDDSESCFSVVSVRMLDSDTPNRLSSTSSDETETDPLNTSDASILRQNNKYRVSFIAENARSPKNRAYVHTPSDYLKKVQISKLKLKQAGEQEFGTFQTGVTAVRNVRGSVIRSKPEMVSRATQTNKSLRYSLIKRNRRFMSDSVVGGHLDTTISSKENTSDKIAENVKHGLVERACVCDNRFYVQQSRSFQDEGKHNLTNGYDVCNTTKGFPLEPKVKVFNGEYHIDKSIKDIEMEDDVFITEPVPNGNCSLVCARCDCNEMASEYMETCVNTTTECTAENCASCHERHNVDFSNKGIVAKFSKSLSDPVNLKQNCFERVSGEFYPLRESTTKIEKNSRDAFCETDEIVEECMIDVAHQSADDLIYDTHYRETDKRACDCHKHICRHRKVSQNSSDVSERMRHNSGRSDTVSVSLTSLESSGYAGEMSSDQSE